MVATVQMFTLFQVPVEHCFQTNSAIMFFFNGWSITEIAGLGINRANWKVVDNNSSRMFIRGSTLVAEHYCKPWSSVERSNRVRFNQECGSFSSYSNVIITDSNGLITYIRQAVLGTNTFLTLQKNSG